MIARVSRPARLDGASTILAQLGQETFELVELLESTTATREVAVDIQQPLAESPPKTTRARRKAQRAERRASNPGFIAMVRESAAALAEGRRLDREAGAAPTGLSRGRPVSHS